VRSPRDPPPIAAGVTQIQLGCLAHCYGTTATVGAAVAPKRVTDAQRILGVLTDRGISIADHLPARARALVRQSSLQWQQGDASTVAQSQRAAQTHAAVLQAAVTAATTETSQAIVQLQIGCLMFCVRTQQYQWADQSTLVVGVARRGARARMPSLAGASQAIWQLQIGCLLWCYDATQQQHAGRDTETALVILPPAARSHHTALSSRPRVPLHPPLPTRVLRRPLLPVRAPLLARPSGPRTGTEDRRPTRARLVRSAPTRRRALLAIVLHMGPSRPASVSATPGSESDGLATASLLAFIALALASSLPLLSLRSRGW
jgi:hypothetical protein